MKKLVLFIYGICFLLLSSCQDDQIVAQVDMEEKLETLQMSVLVPEAPNVTSRTFIDGLPGVNSPLWIVAFDENGFLVEKAKATNTIRTNDETSFNVTLHATSKKRILHFILNYGKDLPLEYGHESTVISKLTVNNDTGVYWQRVEMLNGLNKESTKALKRVPLVRNFAKITMTKATTVKNFNLTGFYVVHKPTSGTVAPYIKDNFATYMNGAVGVSYQDLISQNYKGFMPDGVQYEAFNSNPTWVSDNASSFLYEHTHTDQEENSLTILIKGKYNKSQNDSYYKIDLVNKNKDFYHVLRNFNYEITINSVAGQGKSSAEEAYKGGSSNNLSASVNLKNLSNISNGTAALYVSYVDTVLVTNDPVTLDFKYLDKVGTTTTSNNEILHSFNPGDVFEKIEKGTKDNNGWRTYTITPKTDIPAYPVVQSLTLYHPDTHLSREIVFEYRPALNMIVDCPPAVNADVNQEVPVKIMIPDNINEKFFPLVFRVESQASSTDQYVLQYISPATTEDMAVKTGDSKLIFDTQNKKPLRSFYYEKVLDYATYNSLTSETQNTETYKVLTCNMVTNSTDNASTVHVYNKYFNPAQDSFINPSFTAKFENNIEQQYYGTGHPVKFTIDGKKGKYTLVSKNSSLSFTNSTITLSKDGPFTVTGTTNSWGAPAQVTITYGNEEVTIEGNQPRIYWFCKVKNNGTNIPSSSKSVKVSINKQSKSYPWNKLTSGVEFEIGGNYTGKETVTFEYTTGYGKKKKTYIATTTLEEALTTPLNFELQP